MSKPYYYVIDRPEADMCFTTWQGAREKADKNARANPGVTYTILGSIHDVTAIDLRVENCIAIP